jgi:hypothetical protein
MEESSVVGSRKLRPSKAVYVQLFFGAIFGLIFAFVSDMIPHPEETEVIARLGWREGVDLTWGGYFTISFAGLWSGMALLQAVGLVVCYFNPWFGAKTGVVQMFGGGKQGRLTLWPLAISWFGHAALTALLLVTTLWQVKGTLGWICLLAGVGIIIVIALSTLQFCERLMNS